MAVPFAVELWAPAVQRIGHRNPIAVVVNTRAEVALSSLVVETRVHHGSGGWHVAHDAVDDVTIRLPVEGGLGVGRTEFACEVALPGSALPTYDVAIAWSRVDVAIVARAAGVGSLRTSFRLTARRPAAPKQRNVAIQTISRP